MSESSEAEFEFDKKRFWVLRKEMLKQRKYLDEYVVIVQGEVAGHGKDKVKLAKQIYKNRGYLPMYIGLVSKRKEKRHLELPSPEKILTPRTATLHDDTYLSSIEIEDIRASREERKKGLTKRFSGVDDLLKDLDS